LGQGLAFPLGVLGASRVRGGPYQGAPARAGLETYLRDLQGSAGVGNYLRSSLVTRACCFRTRGDTGPVVSVPLTQSLARLSGSDQGLPGAKWPSLLTMVLVSAKGQPPNPDRYTTSSNH
jgi:hypothetical protein